MSIGDPNVVDAASLSQGLKLAVAVGDAHGADVVALGEKQLDDGSAVPPKPLAGGGDLHPLRHPRGAGGEEPALTLQLHHAEPAGAPDTQPFQIAKARDGDLVLPAYLDNRLVLPGGEVLSVDVQGDDTDIWLGRG
jgi:hypothetical protein